MGFWLRSDQSLCYCGRFGMVPTGGCVATSVHHHHRLVDAAHRLPDAVLPVHGRPHPTTGGKKILHVFKKLAPQAKLVSVLA